MKIYNFVFPSFHSLPLESIIWRKCYCNHSKRE